MTTGFRTVHSPINERDFLPIAKLDPARYPPGTERHCASFAISLFSTHEGILRKFAYIRSTNPNIEKDVGTHVAGGDIDETDGVITKPSRHSGHFSLYEAEGSSLVAKFSIVEGQANDGD